MAEPVISDEVVLEPNLPRPSVCVIASTRQERHLVARAQRQIMLTACARAARVFTATAFREASFTRRWREC